MAIGDQRAADGGTDVLVVPDRRGHRQQPLHDPGDHAGRGAASVSFQARLPLDGFDDLPQGPEELGTGTRLLALAGPGRSISNPAPSTVSSKSAPR